MKLRILIGKITSPIFVPLRRLVVWGDKNFGTCDMRLSLEPRWNHTLDGFADIDESSPQISELMKKVSKDKANFHGWGITEKTPIGNRFTPESLIQHLKNKQEEE